MVTVEVRDPGSRLFADRYELGRSLKSGNGVDTFLAVDRTSGTAVVVKSIDPDVIHAAARLRFEHETHVLRRLQGTNLTGLYDAGEAEGHLFLVQPFIEGSTLEAIVREGPLPLQAALRLGIEVATALEAAHTAGVCHRVQHWVDQAQQPRCRHGQNLIPHCHPLVQGNIPCPPSQGWRLDEPCSEQQQLGI